MSSHGRDSKKIFLEAVEKCSPDEWESFVRKASGGDVGLFERVMILLRAHSDPASIVAESAMHQIEETGKGAFADLQANGTTDLAGTMIGPYKLLEKIGEGGMGVVYMAAQVSPMKRKVALKIIKPGMDTTQVLARFEAERQALSLMEHPNIARVLDGGTTPSGRAYFAMELVRGIPITEYCDRNKVSNDLRLKLFMDVCHAIQHAHQKGIIHRDIKPSNVLVTLHDGVPIVKVIDFGVAKALDRELTERTLFTKFSQMIGTPLYMSPEQAEMSGLDVDTRSDIYSLGVVLYELLTGTTPLHADQLRDAARAELQRLIAEEEVPKPSTRISTLGEENRDIAVQRSTDIGGLRNFVRGDLDWIVMKALDKDRNRRYKTAASFAEDIQRFLRDDAIEARPPSTSYRIRKFIRRNRASVIAVALLLTTLVFGLIGTSYGLFEANRQTKAAQDAESRKEEQRRRAVAAEKLSLETAELRRRELYAANMQLADQLWNSPNGDLKKIEELLAAWIPVDGSEDLREFSWRYQWSQLYKGAALTILETTGAAVSDEGNLLTADGTGIHEWDESGTRLETKWSGDATKVTFSPDGRWAAIVLDGQTQLMEIATSRSAIEIPHERCTFSAGGQFLAAWSFGSQTAQVWSLSGEEPALQEPFVLTRDAKLPNESKSIQLRDDGRSFLVLGHPDYWKVSMFSADDEQPVTWLHHSAAAGCAWSPNGEIVASGSSIGRLHFRLRHDPSKKLATSGHGRNLAIQRFSPDGSRLAVGGSDGTIDLWDTSEILELSNRKPNALASGASKRSASSLPQSASPRLLHTMKAHPSGSVQSLSFSRDGAKLASFANGVSKLWDVEQVKGRYEVEDFGDDLFSGRTGLTLERSARGVTVKSIDAQHLDVVSGEIRVGDRIVELPSDVRGNLMDRLSRVTADVRGLLSGPHRSIVRLAVEDESHQRRDVKLKRTHRADPRPMRVCFSPDGKTVAIAGARHGSTSINLASGHSTRYPQVSSTSVAISPDGRFLAMDGLSDVLVWDLREGREHARLDGTVSTAPIPPNARNGSLAFSPDGKYLAMGTGYSYNDTSKRSDLKVWRVSDLKEVGGEPVFKNSRVLSDITFTPDNAHLVATDHAGIVRVWDTNTWELLDRQFDVGSFSACVAISADGKTLATGGLKHIILWDFETGNKLRVLSGPQPWVLDFSPDGKTLVSGNSNHNVILWDVATGMQLRTFHAHGNGVMGAAFSPDGHTLATVGNEGVLRLWEAAPLAEIERYAPTLEAMFRLGELRMREERYVDAESILVSLLQLQQKRLPSGHDDISRTKAEIKKAVESKRLLAHPPPLNSEP